MNENNDESREFKLGYTSFLIRIIYRQNASWQGEIQWLDQGKKMRFRSLLEMIMLIQEAMETNEAPATEQKIRSWQELDE